MNLYKMQDHGLSEYLSRIDIFSDSDDQPDAEDSNYYLDCYTVPSTIQEGEEPELHAYPFELDKEEEPTQDKTVEVDYPETVSPNPPQEIVFPPECVLHYRQAFNGSKDDTVELNINFKTLLVGYFRELIFLKELSPAEVEQVEQFAERVPSFSSLRRFYGEGKIREGLRGRCLGFLESGECLRRVLQGRSRLKTKLMMVKFIEKMRSNLLEEKVVRWKDRVGWRERPPQ